jgi:hypothetical protein
MRRVLTSLLMSCALLAAMPEVTGQRFHRYIPSSVDRARLDLERIQSHSHRAPGRFERARDDLRRFQIEWTAQRYDRPALDDAIAEMRRLSRASWMSLRDAATLRSDRNILLRFRDAHARP